MAEIALLTAILTAIAIIPSSITVGIEWNRLLKSDKQKFIEFQNESMDSIIVAVSRLKLSLSQVYL